MDEVHYDLGEQLGGHDCEKSKANHDQDIFMKESLRSLMGADFRQEFPWEV